MKKSKQRYSIKVRKDCDEYVVVTMYDSRYKDLSYAWENELYLCDFKLKTFSSSTIIKLMVLVEGIWSAPDQDQSIYYDFIQGIIENNIGRLNNYLKNMQLKVKNYRRIK